MKLFECCACGNVLYFENVLCGRCRHPVAYAPEQQNVLALYECDGTLRPVRGGAPRFFCSNNVHGACNWLMPEGQSSGFCLACRHNGIVPSLEQPMNLARWRELEGAKRRLFYSLMRWQLPLATRQEDPQHGLIFNFLADTPEAKVMTGHDNGIITIALAEADEIERERRRLEMGEPYRTLLGHFRHEVGHHYWDLLVRDSCGGSELAAFRTLFGDDTVSYEDALKRHHDEGPPSDWQERYVSAYASVHPWEDFAETWAHYLHIVDTLEMAGSFGIQVRAAVGANEGLAAKISFDPYTLTTFGPIVEAWLPFVFAMNNVSRAIGARDMYPFILAPAVIEKLNFIHNLVQASAQR